MSEIAIGFIQLLDAAPVIVAAKRGFAAQEGLRLRLDREASWATLRDKLALGIVDAAHMLAPLALATSLGLPPLGEPLRLTAPLALNRNGNAITLSRRLWGELAPGLSEDPTEIALALGRAVRARAAAARSVVRFASVFPYSTHTYQLRAFLRLAGLDPDADVELTVMPPPHMADALARGAIDGFCSGSPWNGVAVETGAGRIAAFGAEITPDAPEKVLAWIDGRVPDETAPALLRAVRAAGRYCADPANHDDLAALLAEPEHLDLDRGLIRRTLAGEMLVDRDRPVRSCAPFIRFGPDVEVLGPADARWVYESMVEAGQITPSAAAADAARRLLAPEAAFGSEPA